MKNLIGLQLKELLDLVDTEACDLTGEHSAKKEILRRFQELEQRAKTAEQAFGRLQVEKALHSRVEEAKRRLRM